MLTKTPVDQNMRPDGTHSNLSVSIFIAPKTHLGSQKCSAYEKIAKNVETHESYYVTLDDCAMYKM